MMHGGISGRRLLARRRLARWPYVLMVTVVVGCTIAASAVAASRAAKITATWNCCGGGGAALQYWTVSESASGSLSGSARTATTVFAKITGQVTGHKVRLVTTYNSFSPGYVATFVGKIGTFNLRMSGTWKSNRGQSGKWTALRAKKPKKKK